MSFPVFGFVPEAILHRLAWMSLRRRTSVQSLPTMDLMCRNCALLTNAPDRFTLVKSASSKTALSRSARRTQGRPVVVNAAQGRPVVVNVAGNSSGGGGGDGGSSSGGGGGGGNSECHAKKRSMFYDELRNTLINTIKQHASQFRSLIVCVRMLNAKMLHDNMMLVLNRPHR